MGKKRKKRPGTNDGQAVLHHLSEPHQGHNFVIVSGQGAAAAIFGVSDGNGWRIAALGCAGYTLEVDHV